MESCLHKKDREIYSVKIAESVSIMIHKILPWVPNLIKLQKNVNSGHNFQRKLRDVVDFRTLITIYLLIIQPHFDYCSQIGACLGTELSDKLQKL